MLYGLKYKDEWVSEKCFTWVEPSGWRLKGFEVALYAQKFWTTNINDAHRCMEDLRACAVWVRVEELL
jgi:hypothetical protein